MSGQVGSATSGPVRRQVLITADAWRRIGWGLFWLSLAAVVAVALGELDRLISSVPGSDHSSHSLNVAISPLALVHTSSWSAWAGAELHQQIGFWIALSAGIDLLLVAALASLFQRLIRISPTNRTVPTVALGIYIGGELLEDLFQGILGQVIAGGDAAAAGALAWWIASFSTIKVLGILILVIAVLRIDPYRVRIGHALRRIGQAVWVHRLATLAILLIALLACIPAADLLDQLPDVQRQWADGDGWIHALCAAAAALLTAAVTFVLGRRRTRLLVETRVMGLQRLKALGRWEAAWPWLIAPGALATAALLAILLSASLGLPSPVYWPTFLILFGIMLGIFAFALFGWRKNAPDEQPLDLDPERARYGWIVGDTLAVLGLVAGGIGVVRSYFAPVLLLPETPEGWTDAQAPAWSIVMVVLGVATALLAPSLLLPWLGTRRPRRSGLDPNARAFGPPPDPKRDADDSRVSPAGWPEGGSILGGAVLLGVGMLFPAQIASAIGGVAVALLAITAWVTVFGAFTLLVQPAQLLPPFNWLKVKAAPVLTLGILVPFALNVVLSAYLPDRDLHAVQVSNPEATAPRDAGTLDRYLAGLQRDDCAIPLVGGDPVRPVFLIAAEGGGIRAAYWTASALAALDGCGARSGFVASGISGGSVGLAVASTVDDLERASGQDASTSASAAADADASIIDAAKRTAGPDVVSTAMLGLAVGDMFAGATGIRVPSASPDEDGDDPGWRWRDRAALIEALWERDAPGLAEPFSSEIDPRTGMLMLNSTDVVSKCRLLVDQAPVLDHEPSGACDSVGGLPSMLGFRELAAERQPDTLANCLASLDWSTAAMLSARFAVVTPTGGLPARPPCDDPKGAQFVDGGYVEPTSLAAIADTAPSLMALLAKHNAARTAGEAWLVPVLVYLRSTQGYDLAADAAQAQSESLVPITGNAARTKLTGENAWLQRIALTLPSACPGGASDAGCATALEALIGPTGKLHNGTVVVAPASTPAVIPPLGWALSKLSQARFTSAISTAAGCDATKADASAAHDDPSKTTTPDAEAGYPGLAALAEVQGFDPCRAVEAQEEQQQLPAD